MSRSTLWRILAVAMPVLGAIAAPLPSVDLTFLLRAGSEILASGAIPTVDTWTFTAAGTPWLDQQWGSEVILQLVYGAAGWTGLVLFRAALVGLAFGLLLATVRRRAPRLGPIPTTLLVIAAFIVSANALALRAQLFAIVLFAATLYVLAIRGERPRAVWLIPLLAILWANLHGTFLFAPALCGLAWLADLYDGVRGGGRARPGSAGARAGSAGEGPARGWALHRMLVVALVATAATAVTPFGPAVWGYVSNLTSNPTIASRVSEWLPPSPATIPGALVWLSVLAVAALAAARVRKTWRARDTTAPRRAGTARSTAFRSTADIPWPALLTLALFGGFALVSGRGTAWWPFVALFVIAPWLAPGGPAAAAIAPPRPTPRPLRRLNLAIVAALALAGIALLPVWRPVGLVGVPVGTLTQAPQGITRDLASITCQQSAALRIWNPQVWGSWLEFAVPCHAYALDSRLELFPKALFDDAAAIDVGPFGTARSVFDRYRVDVVVAEAGSALEGAVAQGGWRTRYVGCDGSIWYRDDTAGASDPRAGRAPCP